MPTKSPSSSRVIVQYQLPRLLSQKQFIGPYAFGCHGTGVGDSEPLWQYQWQHSNSWIITYVYNNSGDLVAKIRSDRDENLEWSCQLEESRVLVAGSDRLPAPRGPRSLTR